MLTGTYAIFIRPRVRRPGLGMTKPALSPLQPPAGFSRARQDQLGRASAQERTLPFVSATVGHAKVLGGRLPVPDGGRLVLLLFLRLAGQPGPEEGLACRRHAVHVLLP